MDIEIKIGREVEGVGALKVPAKFKKVSRRHAVLSWHDGEVTIEDSESANGTFVNGRRIAKTKITEKDTVWLGGNGDDEECYKLDLAKVYNSCREAERKVRTDFSEEFQEVKKVYTDYQAEVAALKKKSTVKSQLPIRIISFIPALVGVVFLVVFEDPNIRVMSISLGSVITGFINILMIGKGNTTNEKLNEDITDIQIKYQSLYKCPKCGKEYNLNMHWKKLEAGGKCPHNCGAEFVKKN